MSYDLHLFKKLEDTTVQETADIVLENETINVLTDEEFKEQKKKVTRAIQHTYPNFEVFDNEEDLSLTFDTYGIQIYLYRNQITINVPYWHTGDEADQVSTILLTCVEILKKETGYVAYDPQSEEEVGLEDKEALKKMYGFGVNALGTIAATSTKPKPGLLPDTKIWIAGIIIVLLGYFLQIKLLFIIGVAVAFFGGNILPFFIKQK